MDDTVPKSPGKPAKAAANAARGIGGVRTAPQPVKTKPTGKDPALVALPVPAVKAAPAVPPILAAKPSPVAAAPKPAPVIPVAKPAPVAKAAPPVAPAPVVPPVAAAMPVEAAPVSVTPAPIVATPPVVASAPIAQPAVKDIIMETIENVADKTQTAFADATDRAKGAVEKSQKLFEDANEFGKGNLEALVESSKIAVRGFEALGQDAAAYAKKSFEEATTAAKTLTSVKSPTEFLKLQADYTRSAFDALVQQTSRNTEAMLKLAGEVAQPLSNRVALAAEKMKVVA